MREPRLRDECVWGTIQTKDVLATGIVLVSTPGHGGIWLSPKRMKAFRSKFPTANLFAGAPWFEEDCDAALVVAAFPDLFSAGAVANAMRMISGRSDIKVEEPKQ